MEGADGEWSRDVKGNMYDVVVDGFQLLSKWTGKVWEQCAWKFARPCKDLTHIDTNKSTASYFDYEKVLNIFLIYLF